MIPQQNSKIGEDGGHDSGHSRFSGAWSSSEDEVTEIRRLRSFPFRQLESVAQLGQLLFDSFHPIHEKKKIILQIFYEQAF
jgi:hypothetical protein